MDQLPGPALRKIFREVHAMVNDPPEGIRMIHSEDITDIQAWIQGPESALNEDAGRLLLERYDDYAQRARMWTTIHAQSAGKDVFTLLKRARAEEQDGFKDGSTPTSSLLSSSAITAGETDGESTAAKEFMVTTLAVKDASKSGTERPCIGDEQPSTTAPSTSSSSSSTSLSESGSTATTTSIPTKRKLGSAENRIDAFIVNIVMSILFTFLRKCECYG
ncbi:hypothetical protein BGX24_011116 [Mortierella sp. AD032]|nr:hypothetical protein BGX24_011116 [Mortierella sp. AD032]